MSFTASYKKLHFTHSIHLHHFTHTKAPFELFRKSTVKERTWLNCTSDTGWLTPVLQTPALCCLRKVTKLPRNIQNNNKKKYHRLASSWVRVGPVILTGYKDLWFSGWRILDLTHAAETTAADAHLSLLRPEGFMVPARVHAQLMGISNCVQLALDKIAVTLSL